jgi:hypothetical protein
VYVPHLELAELEYQDTSKEGLCTVRCIRGVARVWAREMTNAAAACTGTEAERRACEEDRFPTIATREDREALIRCALECGYTEPDLYPIGNLDRLKLDAPLPSEQPPAQ